MKDNGLNLGRLIKLARNIGEPYLRDRLFKREKVYLAEKTGSNIEYFFWALENMPRIFPKHWEYVDGIPRLSAWPTLSPMAGAAHFFGLTMDYTAHLFVPGLQNKFLGDKLSKIATPDDLIANIYALVLFMEGDMPYELTIYEQLEIDEQCKKLFGKKSKIEKHAA